MNKQVKGLLYFFVTDIRHSFLIFWSILMLVLVVSVSFSIFLLGIEDGQLWFGFPFAIYFYSLILGFLTVKQSVPFSIKMGATRKNLYIAIGIFFVGIAVAKSIIANTLQEIVKFIVDKAEITSFNFIHPAMLVEDTWLNRILMDIALMFFLLVIMYVVGLIFYKYGILGGGAVAGVLAILLLFAIAKGWALDFMVNLVKQMDMVFSAQVLGIGLLFYIVSFVLMRRITIEMKI